MISPTFLILGQIKQNDPELFQEICDEINKRFEIKKLEKGGSDDRSRHSENGSRIDE